MPRLYLVRHGRAAAGWNTDPDPGLDAVGRHQAAAMTARLAPLGPLELVSSPLLRCRRRPPVWPRRGGRVGAHPAGVARSLRRRAWRWPIGWNGSASRWRVAGRHSARATPSSAMASPPRWRRCHTTRWSPVTSLPSTRPSASRPATTAW
ncbi:MAG: histidine phosphatase family protein [Acidimicrobiaceae bacterium]|nr:histidine phosphatase family protein [Acidimicrobiaceae bacterium]